MSILIRHGWVSAGEKAQEVDALTFYESDDPTGMGPGLLEPAVLLIGEMRRNPLDAVLREILVARRTVREMGEAVGEDPEGLRERMRLVQERAEASGLGEGKGARAPDVRLVREGLLRDVLKELKQEWEDIGGCDHSVGICACGLARLINELRDAIEEG